MSQAAKTAALEKLCQQVNTADFEILFPKGLDNAVTDWVRMGSPRSTGELIGIVKLGKQKGTHSKKGFQAAMAAVLTILATKNKTFVMTEKQSKLVAAHIKKTADVILLTLGGEDGREIIKTPRLGTGTISVIRELLTQETLEWLGRPWPEVRIEPSVIPQTGGAQMSSSGFQQSSQ